MIDITICGGLKKLSRYFIASISLHKYNLYIYFFLLVDEIFLSIFAVNFLVLSIMFYDFYLKSAIEITTFSIWDRKWRLEKLFTDQECFAVSISAKSTQDVTQVAFCRLNETVYRHTHTHNVNFGLFSCYIYTK